MNATERPSVPSDTTGFSSADLVDRVSEDVFVRNYDFERTYRLTLFLEAVDGSDTYERSYHLRPGQAVSELGVVDAGEYRVRVELDGARRAFDRCSVGPSPAETILVEVGNGVVSVSEGLY